jgi:peptidyl-tRNA hydrolase, PTH1 family
MKYLVTGLGNIGLEYANTRHNIGFDILDALAGASNISFKDQRYGFYAELKHRGRIFCLLKPSTYVNLSGNAVRYYLQKLKLPEDRLLVVTDDIALPFGTIRIRAKGGDAGHNGLAHINTILGTSNYARLRFGIGNEFGRGQQVDYVLGRWEDEEKKLLAERVAVAGEAILTFGTLGVQRTMNLYNNR